jgi:IS30 family transposase
MARMGRWDALDGYTVAPLLRKMSVEAVAAKLNVHPQTIRTIIKREGLAYTKSKYATR